jgi:hypothetical protein
MVSCIVALQLFTQGEPSWVGRKVLAAHHLGNTGTEQNTTVVCPACVAGQHDQPGHVSSDGHHVCGDALLDGTRGHGTG